MRKKSLAMEHTYELEKLLCLNLERDVCETPDVFLWHDDKFYEVLRDFKSSA